MMGGIDFNAAAVAMYQNAKAYDDAIRGGKDRLGLYVGVAANELAAAIDRAGLQYADEMVAPFTDAVKARVAPILNAMRAERAKQEREI